VFRSKFVAALKCAFREGQLHFHENLASSPTGDAPCSGHFAFIYSAQLNRSSQNQQ
jgi:hypothetical protein